MSNTVLLMSGKELLDEVNKNEDKQFIVVRKPKIVLTSMRIDDLPEEIQELLGEFAESLFIPTYQEYKSSYRSYTWS